MNFFDELRGYTVVSLAREDAAKALSLLLHHDIPFFDLCDKDETVCFSLYRPYLRYYSSLRKENRYAEETRISHGLFTVLARYRHRIGFFVGAMLSLILLYLSTLFLWDVKVTGMEQLSEKAVLTALEENGVRLGAYIPALDAEAIEKAMMLDLDGLSWLSLNLRGTVATVEVRERSPNTAIIGGKEPCNLIATCDGQIEALEVTGGKTVVSLGQIVKKGTLLVSGVIDSAALGTRLVCARGSIMARVTCSYDIYISYTQTEKVCSESFLTEKSVKFFSKTINLFGKDSISGDTCDKIETERRLYLFGKIKLPITVHETACVPYEIKEKIISVPDAKKQALSSLTAQCGEELAGATILSRYLTFSEDSTGVTLHADIECIRDIAKAVLIETDS